MRSRDNFFEPTDEDDGSHLPVNYENSGAVVHSKKEKQHDRGMTKIKGDYNDGGLGSKYYPVICTICGDPAFYLIRKVKPEETYQISMENVIYLNGMKGNARDRVKCGSCHSELNSYDLSFRFAILEGDKK